MKIALLFILSFFIFTVTEAKKNAKETKKCDPKQFIMDMGRYDNKDIAKIILPKKLSDMIDSKGNTKRDKLLKIIDQHLPKDKDIKFVELYDENGALKYVIENNGDKQSRCLCNSKKTSSNRPRFAARSISSLPFLERHFPTKPIPLESDSSLDRQITPII